MKLDVALLRLRCWFHRNVAFSALIRGAELAGWKNALTKTWLYRGTLHGVVYDDLPTLLALHAGESYIGRYMDAEQLQTLSGRVISLMEDGVYSRAEMRRIFAYDYDPEIIQHILSPWGGIFVYLAGIGQVAFRDMTSRDFDLIDAEPTKAQDDVLPELLRRFFTTYGPATLSDAAWFLGLWRDGKKKLSLLNLDEYKRIEHNGKTYYYVDRYTPMSDIPNLTLLSGFDPLITSYTQRAAVLPDPYKSAVILKSGICLPTIAVDGQVTGLWNIKKNQPIVEFFTPQSKRMKDDAFGLVCDIQHKTIGRM